MNDSKVMELLLDKIFLLWMLNESLQLGDWCVEENLEIWYITKTSIVLSLYNCLKILSSFIQSFQFFFWDFKFFSQFIEDPFNLDSKPSKKLRFKILVQFIEDRFNFNSKLSKLLRIYNMNIFVILYLKVKKYEPKFAMYLLCLDTTYQKIGDMLYSQFFNLWSR